MPLSPITNGKDFQFFEKTDVSSLSFGGNADVAFNFRGQQSLSIVNEGSDVIEYSFNGNTVHGDMTPSTPTAAIFFDNRRVSKIWFRVAAGGSGTHTIRVEAWAAH